ncbi:MAG: PQQ-like beta-propeller repeat protein [Rhodobacteraceae bacterium]|nr:PQQ-like beta-propeller repeat protein [Paracoccaceae bacterium]
MTISATVTTALFPLCPPRVPRAARLLLITAALGVASGCGNTWFGEPEEILPGERVSLRQAINVDEVKGAVTLPGTRSVKEWPQVGGSSNRALGRLEGSLQLERIWSSSIGYGSNDESRVTAEPVMAGGRVFALDAAAQVTALEADTGDEIWDVDLTPEDEDSRDGFGGGIAVFGDKLVVATGFGQVFGLNTSDGATLWTFQGTAPFRSAPAIAKGVAVVAARDGELIALDVGTGEVKWRVTNIEGGASMLGGAGPAMGGEVVVAPFSSGDIGIFRLSDGKRGWAETLGAPLRGSALAQITDVSSAPIMAGSQIVAGGVSGRLVSLDIPTGRRLWARDIGAYNRAWAAGDTVYIISESARLFALSLADGLSAWEKQLPRYDDPENRADPFAYGGPVLVGENLYITSSEGVLFEISAVDGSIRREEDFPGESSIPPIYANGVLYILDSDGDLHAYK